MVQRPSEELIKHKVVPVSVSRVVSVSFRDQLCLYRYARLKVHFFVNKTRSYQEREKKKKEILKQKRKFYYYFEK